MELRPLTALLPRLEQVHDELECATSRANRAEAQLDQMLDHLRVVEVAMTSLGEARDDAARSLAEARRAAGLLSSAMPLENLADRISRLIRDRDHATTECAELRSWLRKCYTALQGRADAPASSSLLECIRRVIDG